MQNTQQLKELANLRETERRKLAAEAEVDVRTLGRYIAGRPVRLMVRDRIERAIVSMSPQAK